MSKQTKYSMLPTFPRLTAWFNTKQGCIVAIAACFLFIAIFVANILVNHAWLNIVFIAAYAAVIANRLKQLRSLHD